MSYSSWEHQEHDEGLAMDTLRDLDDAASSSGFISSKNGETSANEQNGSKEGNGFTYESLP